ncbi:MAG: alanine racemase [Myxococcales bacterium]|nr:alanine racemase [Myxococcota bacterium]MDW8283944.1 alanine racemase [Myxococcales bacterium]
MAEIDLGALRRNVDAIRAELGPSGVGVLAVVKADAYGHGAVACARALERKVWGFAVSLVEEGVELRRSGIELPIVVLGCYYGQAHRDVVAYRLTPVVGDPADLGRFSRAADELAAARLGVHLKVDTGMSRLGVRPERLSEFIEELGRHPGVMLAGLCTHLAEADAEDPMPTREQLIRFEAVRAALVAAGLRVGVVHVANSAALVRFASARYDLVRPGLALYGVAPPHSPLRGLWPVMSLKTRVIALREVPAGTGVSYGGLYRTPGPARIATLPIGYADGYTRRMTGRAQVLLHGRRCPVVGAISMDMIMVDVTAVPEVTLGDEAVLLGAQGSERICIEEMAAWAGTIPWEVCSTISKRVPRIYTGSG